MLNVTIESVCSHAIVRSYIIRHYAACHNIYYLTIIKSYPAIRNFSNGIIIVLHVGTLLARYIETSTTVC